MRPLFSTFAALLLVAGFAAPALARQRQSIPKPVTPEAFVQSVVNAKQLETQSSELALQKSHNDAIRKYAQLMIDDNKKIGDELHGLLKQANMPEPGVELDKEHQAILTRLQSLNGAAFDGSYVREQRIGHAQAVRFLEGYSRRGQSEPLKQFALRILPTEKENLKMAAELRGGRNLSARR